jgi:hypothetical protein
MVLTSRHAVGASGLAVRPARSARLRQVGVLCFQPDDSKPRVKVAFRLPYKVRAGSRVAFDMFLAWLELSWLVGL